MFHPLCLLFTFASFIYLLLDIQLIRGLRKLKKSSANKPNQSPSITVLIAARNEEKNLPRVLNVLLAQDYPGDKTQIVVINDRSEDGTESVLRRYTNENPGKVEFLNIQTIPPNMSPKKHALFKGLEIAKGEWIAVTDADCIMGPQWLSSMSNEFSEDTGMVLGFTGYEESQKGFSMGQGAQALEFVSYGVVSSALIGLGFPVIANANNLAYRRKAFNDASALRQHGHIVSGDDDFVLQEIHATGKWAIRYSLNPQTLMRTALPDSWEHFWEQRKRWASKCMMYRPRQIAFLAMIFAFYAAVPILLIAGFWNTQWAWLGLGVFLAKTVGDFAVTKQGLKIFGLGKLLRFFPHTALLHIPLIVCAVLAGTFGGFTWKGQKLSRRA